MLLSKTKTLNSLLTVDKWFVNHIAGLKNFKPPPPKRQIEYPERMKLRMVDKVPQYPQSQRPFHMQKRLRLMRGPEEIHNELIHKQFGIVAMRGGRLKYQHFETIRLIFSRRFKEFPNLFAIWRVESPWQPMTKKGIGHKMGGGKGAIDHYATPIKADRIILEVGGDIEYYQIQEVLGHVARKLPFPAKAVTYEEMESNKVYQEMLEKENINPYTWKYVVQNNLGGCHKWVTPYDKKYFNKYL